jgi:hypothetical protein
MAIDKRDWIRGGATGPANRYVGEQDVSWVFCPECGMQYVECEPKVCECGWKPSPVEVDDDA